MNISNHYLKRISLLSAALVLIVAILISLFVIQPVAVDSHPGVPHERIVFIWGVNITVNILVGYILVLISQIKKEGIGWIITSSILLFIIFLLAFACNDAAMAYLSHGPDMQSVALVLFISAGIEVVVWLLILSTIIFRKRIMKSFQNA